MYPDMYMVKNGVSLFRAVCNHNNLDLLCYIMQHFPEIDELRNLAKDNGILMNSCADGNEALYSCIMDHLPVQYRLQLQHDVNKVTEVSIAL